MTDLMLLLLPTDGLPSPHPEAPPGVDHVATLPYVAAFAVLAVGLVVAVVGGLGAVAVSLLR
ncbi:hypothetical protein [Cutibacterium sp. V947]|uniref:hypothetical protein n=1 Tax=unclassified Cutibacterium TaxID=2649671 RepID=UPI003EE0BEC6